MRVVLYCGKSCSVVVGLGESDLEGHLNSCLIAGGTGCYISWGYGVFAFVADPQRGNTAFYWSYMVYLVFK